MSLMYLRIRKACRSISAPPAVRSLTEEIPWQRTKTGIRSAVATVSGIMKFGRNKMKTKAEYQYETEIEAILSPGKPRRRGRRPTPTPKRWSLDFYNPCDNRTFALISMCIKDDFDQSIEQLALRLAMYKDVSPVEALQKLRALRGCGRLGYYDDKTLFFRTWHGKEAGYGLEDMCG